MSIPLIQEATKDAINTSIIAIKRNIERINMLLGLVDNDSPDLSGFATKQELQDAVTELQPVDEVTVGNMHSVTSNAVAVANSYSITEHFTGKYWIDGKPIYRKVIDCGALPSNGQKTFQNVMSNTDKIIKITGATNNGIATISLPYSTVNSYINIYCPTKTDLIVEDNGDFSVYYQTYVTLEYTKTTD